MHYTLPYLLHYNQPQKFPVEIVPDVPTMIPNTYTSVHETRMGKE